MHQYPPSLAGNFSNITERFSCPAPRAYFSEPNGFLRPFFYVTLCGIVGSKSSKQASVGRFPNNAKADHIQVSTLSTFILYICLWYNHVNLTARSRVQLLF
jgi:hypothetical protein